VIPGLVSTWSQELRNISSVILLVWFNHSLLVHLIVFLQFIEIETVELTELVYQS